MATRCTVCQDPRLQQVDALLASGRSARSLAVELGFGIESMKRHARSHAARRASAPPLRKGSADPLDELVDALRPRALTGSDSGTAREYRLALAAQKERSAERPVYDVLADPEWIRLRTLMLDALRPYPDARQAVAEAIRADLSDG